MENINEFIDEDSVFECDNIDINEERVISSPMKEEMIIKGKIRVSRQIFPKGNVKVNNGDFAILSVNILDVSEGDPKISKYGTITITGNMCEINENEIYKFVGKEIEDERFGTQYEKIFIGTDVKLENREDQYKFLEKILTENQCIELFKVFDNPVDILEAKDMKSLCKVKGIGMVTAEKLIEKYEANKDYSEAYIKLDKYGISKNSILRLVEAYGSPDIAVAKVQTNPYILIDEVDGIGWEKADEMALKTGIQEYSTMRVKAYIKNYLNNEASNGNTWVWIDDLLDSIDGTIGCELPQDVLENSLKELRINRIIWTNSTNELIALYKFYNLERSIAMNLNRLVKAENTFKFNDWESKVKQLEDRQGWCFTDEQRLGIKTILENQVVIVQGLAGTGKSTTVLGMLEVFGDDYTYAQTALSGRASCNLTDITGSEGYTIHRLLGFNPESGFNYNKDNPLPTDIIILDELSMVGADIFFKLIQAIRTGAKLIMLGDIGQLEAIGVGNIMMDMMESGFIKVVNLTKIHRQASKSAVITESKKVYEHQQIIDRKFFGNEIRGELQDLELDIYSGKEMTHNRIVEHFEKLLKVADSPFDIQVIVPLKDRGKASAYYLNNSLQPLVIDTKKNRGLIVGKDSKFPFTLYVGDKVINNKNNYKALNEWGDETPIFNGDLGKVVYIDYDKETLVVDFNTKGRVYISKKHLQHIKLGYAVTTHKLQGSSSPYVICGLDYSHYMLLNKEMVYTMLTRTKKYCVLCAENRALVLAVSTSEVKSKQTFLKAFLNGEIPLEIVA